LNFHEISRYCSAAALGKPKKILKYHEKTSKMKENQIQKGPRISDPKKVQSGVGRGVGEGGRRGIFYEKQQQKQCFQKKSKRGLTSAWGKRNVRPVRLKQGAARRTKANERRFWKKSA
jgi:hypothetical protein